MNGSVILKHYSQSKNYRVTDDEYAILENLILEECVVPENLFPREEENNRNCYFLFGYETCRFLFVDSGYESFTGYLPKEHRDGGLDFWFSKVHPEDRKMLSERIIESLRITKNAHNRNEPAAQILNYRFKKGTGEWIWMQHTVYNLSFDKQGKVNKVLHRLRLLDVLSYPEELTAPVHKISLKRPDELHKLTERERQILKLIGEGFSTKMIADMLKISINTVETHRRHLLEKLNAKNSMELIKKAFMIFWS